MVTKYMKRTCTNLLMTLMVILPVYAEEDPRPCDVNHILSLLALLDMDLSGYEKESRHLDLSAEGTVVDYYYEEDVLKAIVGGYYRHSGRLLVAFYFESQENYMVELIEYTYTWPFDVDNWGIAGKNQFSFPVCQNELSYGFSDYRSRYNHETSNRVLKTLLEHAPRGN
ncbi:MAG: hypothetical protein ACR2PR_12220 [Pseudohongiellaceae bacterium]